MGLLSPADTALLDSLDRHARRRAEGIPTLSVLVGPQDRARLLWDEWLHRSGLKAASSGSEDLRTTVSTWASALTIERNLSRDAESYVVLSQRAFSPRELHFEGKTPHERHVLFERLEPPHSEPATWALCRQLLVTPSPAAPGELSAEVREAITRDPLRLLHALLCLIPEGRAPALHLRVSPSDSRSLRTATALCTAAPMLHIACMLPPEALGEPRGRKETHALAMLREGLLELPDPSSTSAPLAPRTPSPEQAPSARPHAQDAKVEPLLERFRESAQAVHVARQKDEARARSKAERFLYNKILQVHPATRGLFALNATLDLGDGSRPLEVDFLCRELRLAVEIDGYHHFLDPERFRRDRRKDLALQRAGYWVARFLEEDVVPRYEEILKTIEALMAARRQEAAAQRTTHGQP
ncbi:endonuclease domain-containing protein [Corallococcus terminator]